jgi:hypothetical protein
MSRRGTADGSRLLGWDRLRAEQRARRGDSPGPEHDITGMLRALHARIVPPSERRPYWSVFRRYRFLGAGKTPARAVKAACRTMFRHPS